MSERQSDSASSSSSGIDPRLYVRLCEEIVQRINGVVNRGKLLHGRQCKLFLADYLSRVVLGVKYMVLSDMSQKAALTPALGALYRLYKKAEVLVTQCEEGDWCAAAVFQGRIDISIMYIRSCIHSIVGVISFFEDTGTSMGVATKLYSDITSIPLRQVSFSILDKLDILGTSYAFESLGLSFEDLPAFVNCRDKDWDELRQRLEGLGSEQSSSFWFPRRQAALKQHLARYLLKKIKFQSELQTTTDNSLEALKSILWEKDDEPLGTWGEVKFLGSGTGASGVVKTSWLGVPCAKKEFHDHIPEILFVQEALIMARLKKHPCIVDFICCGNGNGKGDRFIAMELMEKSLYELIRERKGVQFSHDVALDIIWQIADGVNFLHKHGIAHRDLKSQNVLVKTLRSPYHEDYYCVKLADFGTCKSEVEASTSYMASFPGVGTTRYRAPEAFPNAHAERMGKVDWMRADAYSFAMTCAHVLTMKQPFEDMKVLNDFYEKLLKGRRPNLSTSACSKELIELMEECWSTESSRRPKFDTILSKLEDMSSKNLGVGPFRDAVSMYYRYFVDGYHGVMYVDRHGVIRWSIKET